MVTYCKLKFTRAKYKKILTYLLVKYISDINIWINWQKYCSFYSVILRWSYRKKVYFKFYENSIGNICLVNELNIKRCYKLLQSRIKSKNKTKDFRIYIFNSSIFGLKQKKCINAKNLLNFINYQVCRLLNYKVYINEHEILIHRNYETFLEKC